MSIVKECGPKIEIVAANYQHSVSMSTRLRESDVRELAMTSPLSTLETLNASLAVSVRSYAVLVNDLPTILFGIAEHPNNPRWGIPWLLATEDLYLVVPEFKKLGKSIFKELVEGFDTLANVTDPRNEVAVRWLKHLGFDMGPELPGKGLKGETLLYFSMDLESRKEQEEQ